MVRDNLKTIDPTIKTKIVQFTHNYIIKNLILYSLEINIMNTLKGTATQTEKLWRNNHIPA